MTSGAFFNGISPSLWYANSLFNQVFGTDFSPVEGLPADISAKSWAGADNTGKLSSLNGLYQRQYDLLAAADKLSTANRDSVFYQQSAASSNSNAASVSYFNGDNYSGAVPDSTFDVEVTSLAREQINQGTILDPLAASAVNTGTNTFTLTVGGTGYNLSLEVYGFDTNQSVLGRMASVINAAGAGVTAAVLSGSGGDRLQITGEVGSANAFTLADVSGNAVSALGANSAAQSAANAVYTVDGAAYNQTNNRVFLMDGKLEIELTGAGSATVTVGPDTSAMSSAIGDLVSAMNNLGSYLASNQHLTTTLATEWSRLVRRTEGSLSDFGIDLGASGQLSLDSGLLNSALADDPTAVREAFGGYGGLVSQVKAFGARVASSPGADLLQSPPTGGLGYLYLKSLSSAPRFRLGSSLFWSVA